MCPLKQPMGRARPQWDQCGHNHILAVQEVTGAFSLQLNLYLLMGRLEWRTRERRQIYRRFNINSRDYYVGSVLTTGRFYHKARWNHVSSLITTTATHSAGAKPQHTAQVTTTLQAYHTSWKGLWIQHQVVQQHKTKNEWDSVGSCFKKQSIRLLKVKQSIRMHGMLDQEYKQMQKQHLALDLAQSGALQQQ